MSQQEDSFGNQDTIKEPETETETATQPKKKKEPKKQKAAPKKERGHKYQDVLKYFDPQKSYPLDEALELVKKVSYAKFDATIETHFSLNINPQKNEQQIRTMVQLPHGTGKKITILAFVPDNEAKEVEKLGALIADKETVEKITDGWLGFDMVVAHPSFMPQLAKVSKRLGPKGLMPNPKAGTVGENIPEIIKGMLGGKIEIRNQSDSAVLHTIIGKASFSDISLKENFTALYRALLAAKPPKVKDPYIKNCVLVATMGPGIKVNLTNL